MMVDETIIADEQETTQDVETTETDEGVATNSEEEVVSKAEYDKAKAEAEKREGRYKSNMKKWTNVTSKPTKDKDGLSTDDFKAMIDERLTNIKEEEAFIREHGKDALNDELRNVMNQHPTLSYEEAFALTSVWQDPAAAADANTTTVVWTTGNVSWQDANTITQTQLYALSDAQYSAMRDKIDKGAVKLID